MATRRFLSNNYMTAGSFLSVNNTSPKFAIDINSNNTTSGALRCNNTTGPAIVLGGTASTTANVFLSCYTTSGNNSVLLQLGKSSSTNNIGQITFNTGGTNNAQLVFYGGNWGAYITQSGYIGIGTSTPNATVQVTSNKTNGSFPGGYVFNAAGSGSWSAGSYTAGVYCSGRVASQENNAWSDSRIKKNVYTLKDQTSYKTSNSELLTRLNPVTYNYIDMFEKGVETKYGFIAQEIDALLVDSVSKMKDYIPNIYSMAKIIESDSDNDSESDNETDTTTLQLKNELSNTIKVGDKLQIIDPKGIKKYTTIININAYYNEITIDASLQTLLGNEQSHEEIFVYGTEINDYHVLDYDAVFTVGISLLQDLHSIFNNSTLDDSIDDKINNMLNEINTFVIV